MPDPATGLAATTISKAAEFGMFALLAVVVICGLGYIVIDQIKRANRREERMDAVVAANTQAVATLGPIMQKLCTDLSSHDHSTGEAVRHIEHMRPVLDEVNMRTAGIEKMFWMDKEKGKI